MHEFTGICKSVEIKRRFTAVHFQCQTNSNIVSRSAHVGVLLVSQGPARQIPNRITAGGQVTGGRAGFPTRTKHAHSLRGGRGGGVESAAHLAVSFHSISCPSTASSSSSSVKS